MNSNVSEEIEESVSGPVYVFLDLPPLDGLETELEDLDLPPLDGLETELEDLDDSVHDAVDAEMYSVLK